MNTTRRLRRVLESEDRVELWGTSGQPLERSRCLRMAEQELSVRAVRTSTSEQDLLPSLVRSTHEIEPDLLANSPPPTSTDLSPIWSAFSPRLPSRSASSACMAS